MPTKTSLPIDPLLPEITAWLEEHSNLVLTAEPGAGKTTRVPAALLAAPFASGRQIWVLQPRRLAARVAAQRVAWEMGQEPGQIVGYQFRFERKEGPATRLKFMTEGMLLRLAQSNPGLEGVAAVVLDEFHERSLSLDLSLAWLKRLQAAARPDLRLVVMSATLDSRVLARHLDGAKVLESKGRLFPVTVDYLPGEQSPRLEDKVAAGLEALRARGWMEKGCLVFLPGVPEILRCQRALAAKAGRYGWALLGLYGDLPPAEQARVLEPLDRPKVILSTNLAETSLTVTGIQAVLDSGLVRQPRVSPWSGLSALVTVPASQASATQRAGRAGRLEDGYCLRLYSRYDFEHRAAFDLPEIQRADLSRGFLDLMALGCEDPAGLPYLEPPPAGAADAARSLLEGLGATAAGQFTAAGRQLASLPLHPRLGKLLLAAEGVLRPPLDRARGMAFACKLACLLSEERLSALSIWDDLKAYQPEGEAARLYRQLLERFKTQEGRGAADEAMVTALQRALLSAFPDRIGRARRLQGGLSRGAAPWEVVLATGGSLSAPEHVLFHDGAYLVVLEAAGPAVRSFSPISPDWLLDMEGRLREQEEFAFNPRTQRVEGSRSLVYGTLVLDSTALKAGDRPERAAVLLADAALSLGLGAFWDAEALQTWAGRLEVCAQFQPGPWDFSPADLLRQACQGLSSFSELRQVDWAALARAALGPRQAQALEALAPQQVSLKSGRSVRVHYAPGDKPWIESRIQDFFGMAEGPRIAQGRLALVLHLLAPNRRPVQVTGDLSGFWEREYPDLRRQFLRRYPRHDWRENPL